MNDVPSTPPVAPLRPHVRVVHDTEIEDPYFWMRDREDPEVIAYLEAENEHTSAAVAGWGELPETLFQEIKSRIQETDMSVPVRKDGWWYQARTVEGSKGPVQCPWRASPAGRSRRIRGPMVSPWTAMEKTTMT